MQSSDNGCTDKAPPVLMDGKMMQPLLYPKIAGEHHQCLIRVFCICHPMLNGTSL